MLPISLASSEAAGQFGFGNAAPCGSRRTKSFECSVSFWQRLASETGRWRTEIWLSPVALLAVTSTQRYVFVFAGEISIIISIRHTRVKRCYLSIDVMSRSTGCDSTTVIIKHTWYRRDQSRAKRFDRCRWLMMPILKYGASTLSRSRVDVQCLLESAIIPFTRRVSRIKNLTRMSLRPALLQLEATCHVPSSPPPLGACKGHWYFP